MDPKHNDEKEFAYGSGLLNPVRALDPGLVFNTSKTDYINFLCRQGYNSSTMTLITSDQSTCGRIKPGRGWDLNYPSFSLAIEDGQKIMGNFTRKVTNVGSRRSIYNASIDVPEILQVKVEPYVLSFTKIGEEKSFSVIVDGPPITQVPIISGSITWKDGVHEVRTPLVVYTVIPKALSNHPFQEITTKSTIIESSIDPRNKIFFQH